MVLNRVIDSLQLIHTRQTARVLGVRIVILVCIGTDKGALTRVAFDEIVQIVP